MSATDVAIPPGTNNDPLGQGGRGGDDAMETDTELPESNDQNTLGWGKLHDPPRGKSRDIFPAIKPFADPYNSPFITSKPRLAQEVLDCLKHVNCSYLSSGVPPNLLQLKQHAQSLTVLIREMTISTLPALIDNEHAGTRPFHENESFDWLNDLQKPYFTMEAHHRQPLTSILNTIETNPVTCNPRNKCPLQQIDDTDPMVPSHPYARHEPLIQHANEVLERLDHEYSARGGLLSIFPADMKKEDREKAEKTVLGQMIFWVQNLVQRIHHLERLYANAMDLLAKEAVVPTETLSSLGTRGRKGREVVYPQDKFVLVNAGDDLWEFLNAEFERKEVIDTQVDKNYRDLGATGEAIWAQRGGKEFAKGITFIDVYTRYYRLRDNPLKTVFVIPAYEIHPGTKVTREIEQQPTVVSVVKPVWPERMSVLEAKHKGDMASLKQLQRDDILHKHQIDGMKRNMVLSEDNRSKLKQENRDLKQKLDEAMSYLKQPVNASKFANFEALGRANAAQMEAVSMRAQHERQIEETITALEEAKTRVEEMRKAREAQDVALKAREEECKRECDRRKKELDDYDADIARSALDVNKLFKQEWLKQFGESQVLLQFLADRDRQAALAGMEIPDHIKKDGEPIAKRKFDAVADAIPDVIPKTKKEPEPFSSSEDEDETSGGGGVGVGQKLSKAPAKASWRKESKSSQASFSSGWSVQDPITGDPKNTHFVNFGNTGQAVAVKTSPVGSVKTTSPGWSHKSSIHGSSQNPQFVTLGPTATSPTQESPGSANSMKTFAPGSPKKVEFSATEMAPTGSGSGEPPSKKAKTTGKSPKLTRKGIPAPQMATRGGAMGSGGTKADPWMVGTERPEIGPVELHIGVDAEAESESEDESEGESA
jgi:hypothetical protein